MAAHKVYCYKQGNCYRYSIRSCNNRLNSLGNGLFVTRGGRNKAVNKLLIANKDWIRLSEVPPKEGISAGKN